MACPTSNFKTLMEILNIGLWGEKEEEPALSPLMDSQFFFLFTSMCIWVPRLEGCDPSASISLALSWPFYIDVLWFVCSLFRAVS